MLFSRKLDGESIEYNHETSENYCVLNTIQPLMHQDLDLTDARFVEVYIDEDSPYYNPDRILTLTIGTFQFPIGPYFCMMFGDTFSETSWRITNPDPLNQAHVTVRIHK